MTTSGTYDFDPSLGNLVLNAFSRIQITRTMVRDDQLQTARLEANLLLQAWANLGVNLWTVDLQTETLVAGTATYTLDRETVSLLDVYVTATSTDRILFPISRSEYASYADKTQQGIPTVFYFNRLITPQVTLWPVPDDTYVLSYYRMKTIQDANLAGGETLDLPNRFDDAFTAGLAHRLARHYKPELEDKRKIDAEQAWSMASMEDVQDVPIYVRPDFSSYTRR